MKTKIIIFVGLFLFLVPNVALSDVPNEGALDAILQAYINAASTWETTLNGFAIRLFWILAITDFVWMAINLALNPGEFTDIFANVIRKILFIGFFLLLLQQGPTWAKAIISSFQTAANTLSTTTSSSPSGIFGMGFNLAVKIFDAISVRHPIDSLGYVIAGYIIMIVFALIAAMVLIVTVQVYITIYAGIILLGFGGSTFTKDIALMYLKSAFSVGAKLFIMLLITRLGTVVVDNWIQTFTNITFKQLCLFIGASIVLLALVKAIPDIIGDMINGFSWGSGDTLVSSSIRTGKAIAGGAVAATAGAIGGTMAVREAAKMGGSSGASTMLGKTASTVSNLGKASAQQVGQQISGTGPRHGNAAGRTAAILKANRLTTSNTLPQDESYHGNTPVGSINKDTS